ncbi:hypothetical protein F8M41_003647, partial [Gigaspora margarita]
YLHVSLIVLIVAKDDKTSHTQGLANINLIKTFFNLLGNFAIEEENEYIMVAHASIVDIGNPDNGFAAEETPYAFRISSLIDSLGLAADNVEEGWVKNVNEERQEYNIDEKDSDDNEVSEEEQEKKRKN